MALAGAAVPRATLIPPQRPIPPNAAPCAGIPLAYPSNGLDFERVALEQTQERLHGDGLLRELNWAVVVPEEEPLVLHNVPQSEC